MISKTSLLLLLLSIVALASAISVQRVPIADVTSAPAHFVQNKLAKSYELVQFKILLKQVSYLNLNFFLLLYLFF